MLGNISIVITYWNIRTFGHLQKGCKLASIVTAQSDIVLGSDISFRCGNTWQILCKHKTVFSFLLGFTQPLMHGRTWSIDITFLLETDWYIENPLSRKMRRTLYHWYDTLCAIRYAQIFILQWLFQPEWACMLKRHITTYKFQLIYIYENETVNFREEAVCYHDQAAWKISRFESVDADFKLKTGRNIMK
jgi:hypothetical protein